MVRPGSEMYSLLKTVRVRHVTSAAAAGTAREGALIGSLIVERHCAASATQPAASLLLEQLCSNKCSGGRQAAARTGCPRPRHLLLNNLGHAGHQLYPDCIDAAESRPADA